MKNISKNRIYITTEDFKNDYISLTAIARYKNTDDPRFVIQNWMRNRNTLEFLGLCETMYNENFNSVELYRIKSGAGIIHLHFLLKDGQ